MNMSCEKCGKELTATQGKFLYYQDRMIFACRACADKLDDEIKCARRICSSVDSKKTQAEQIATNKDAFDAFLKDMQTTLKKIPNVGNLRSDIPLLITLVKSYINGDYCNMPYNSIIAIIATLLYVHTPIDIIPDVIPGIGFTDDAIAIALCIRMIRDNLQKYQNWRENQKT